MPLTLEIVTPEGIAWKDENVVSITLPVRGGEMQVLEGHVPFVVMLDIGDIKIVDKNGNTEDLAVDAGYARLSNDSLSVLTEAAIKISEIDFSVAEEAKEAAQTALENARKDREIDPEEIRRLEAAVNFAMAQVMKKKTK